MAQGIYIGVDQQAGGGATSINSTAELEQYFAVSSSNFAYRGGAHPAGWYSTNKSDSSSGTFIMRALDNYSQVSFSYAVSSESNYDQLTLTINGTRINITSGTGGTVYGWAGAIAKDDVIQFTYIKDHSNSVGADQGWFYNFVITLPIVEAGEFAREIIDLAIGVDGVSRRVLYGYIGVEGVARPCYTVKPATWAKYSCTSNESSIYVEDDEPSTVELERNVTNWTIPNYCTFSSDNGYRLFGVQGNYGPGDGLTGSDLKDTWMNTSGGQIAYYIKSATVVDDGTTLSITITALLYRAEKITATTYTKGTTLYGTVISDTGGLPAEGTYVEGSIKDGYCVCKVNSTYYYYVLQ